MARRGIGAQYSLREAVDTFLVLSPCRLLMSHSWLLGTWRLLKADAELDFAPGVRMEFRDGGLLHYHIDVAGTDQVVALVYRVDGDVLHTENPIAPHSMSVRVTHGAGDVLLLDFAGAQAMLVRETDARGATE